MVDAAKDYAARKNSGGAVNSRMAPSNLIRIKNISGSDAPRFAILGIDGVVFEPGDAQDQFKNAIAFTGNSPEVAKHSQGRFVITAEPIANSAIGMAHATGLCRVQIKVTDEIHQFADITEGDKTVLTSATGGPLTILWKETGTGVKWAVVRFGAVSGGGGSSLIWVEIMHKVDDQADYYEVKIGAWSPTWQSGVIYYKEDLTVTPPVMASTVRLENYEYKCLITHTSNWALKPDIQPNYWKRLEVTKAYAKGNVGCLSTCLPQFEAGEFRAVEMHDDKFYFVETFIQGGYKSGNIWVPGSLGWLGNRGGALYR